VRRGVESAGVEGGARSDKEMGGGLVEASPLNETHQWINYIYGGTVSTLQKAGFKTIAPTLATAEPPPS